MELKAPAKVNWHLAVGSKRPDGYHPILSVFQLCSLHDVLEVELSSGPFSVSVQGLEALCEKGTSTLDKAAVLWHEETGFDRAVNIKIKKNIPSSAGLGGGSSDAASLLLYLNSLREKPFDRAALMSLGAKVGCDLPFFLSGCNAAVVTGLGEKVRPIEARTDLSGFIIIRDTEKVSTKEAYSALDSRKNVPVLDSYGAKLEQIYRRPVGEWSFYNDFDMVNAGPDIRVLKGEKLILTGSGSCYVLLTDRKTLELPRGCKAVKVEFHT